MSQCGERSHKKSGTRSRNPAPMCAAANVSWSRAAASAALAKTSNCGTDTPTGNLLR